MRLMDTVRFRDLGITHGQGPRLFSPTRGWLDFFTDVGTASLGYGSGEAEVALRAVLDSGLVHSPILFTATVRNRAAQMVTDMTGMERVFFCNSGAEAAEGAIKLARLHHHRIVWSSAMTHHAPRETIWTYKGGFHGRTLATLAAGDGPPYHSEGFGPLPDGFEHFTDISEISPRAAAVMLAPVFGNNDVRPYPDGWLQELRSYTEKHGILLILDEVQTGSGRCGAPTYAQRAGVQPDIITLGKGVAMGAPVGVVLARGPVASSFTPGSHFSTFGANPLCCQFIIGMWEWLGTAANLRHVEDIGVMMEQRLMAIPSVGNIRRVGALVAANLDCNSLALATLCEQRGLLLGVFRSGPGPLKLTPPLNTPLVDIDEGMEILADALAVVG